MDVPIDALLEEVEVGMTRNSLSLHAVVDVVTVAAVVAGMVCVVHSLPHQQHDDVPKGQQATHLEEGLQTQMESPPE